VCIVGAGPGGLAALSAVLEPYSVDLLSQDQVERAARSAQPERLSVCVVDPQPWLACWKARFAALDIGWLRSPSMAHPDAFDSWSLAEFARAHGRESELQGNGSEYWKAIGGLGQTQAGFYNLPSSELFIDFCDDLVARLPHDFVRGQAVSVCGEDGAYSVKLSDGGAIAAGAVVLALGVPGPRIVPPAFQQVPAELAFHTEDLGRLAELREGWRVLVVGGGLTAVQAAQLAVKRGCKATLCSRRQLVTRNFDIPIEWFDPRTQGRLRHDFWAEPLEARLQRLRAAKGGGSVPLKYMEELRAAEAAGRAEVVCAEAEVVRVGDEGVDVKLAGRTRHFNRIVLACGHRPDCLALPLLRDLCSRWPVPVVGGLPVVSKDLQWGERQVFVVGALAGLAVGPDAANLMGCRRAAQVVAVGLGLHAWQRSEQRLCAPFPVAGNRYSALLADSDDECSTDAETVDTSADTSGSSSP